jgi:tRNA A37 threonylcarbamoyladenosine modification protein TsaB
LAQGWQLARGLRLLGISSVEALAAQAQAASLHGQVHVLIDAQRNEFYGATYRIEPNSLTLDSPLHLLTASQADSLADNGHLVGEPALRSRWPQLHPMAPDAAMLGRLAAHRTDFIAGEVLEPIYLRETNFVKAPPPRVPS